MVRILAFSPAQFVFSDLKKTLAVLLDNIMERLDSLERKVSGGGDFEKSPERMHIFDDKATTTKRVEEKVNAAGKNGFIKTHKSI